MTVIITNDNGNRTVGFEFVTEI